MYVYIYQYISVVSEAIEYLDAHNSGWIHDEN